MTVFGERFDAGHDWVWHPGGTFALRQSINTGRTTVVNTASMPGPWVRVDWAMVNVEIGVLDLNACAELLIDLADTGLYVPILTVSASMDDPVGGFPVARCVQLSRPFVLGFAGHIALDGHTSAADTSSISAMVALSWANAPTPGT
jgi:hypothetical protein